MDIFLQGVEVTVMGFIIVIAVFAFICFVLMIFNVVANLENKKIKAQNETVEQATNNKTVKEVSEPVVQEQPLQDDLELIAVITAAIAAQAKVGPDKLVVRSIRRVSSWNKEAVTEQQNNIF